MFKIGIPLQTPVLFYIKKLVYKGVYITWICYPDVICRLFLKVKVGTDKEMAQSERNSHYKN